MNSIKYIFSMISLVVLTFSCSQPGKSVSYKTEIYCDHCQTCESCKMRVENALKAVSGVKSAEMKISEKTISVDYDETKIDEQKIKLVIAGTGYDAGDVKADPAAYDNLDDCCKKK